MQNRRKKEEKIEICTKCEQNLIKFIKCFKIRKKLFTNQKKGGILTFVLKKRHSFKMPGFDLGGEIIMKKRTKEMYELTEQKKNDISVYGVKYGVLQIDDISADKDKVEKFVDDINKYQLSPIHLGDVVADFVESM